MNYTKGEWKVKIIDATIPKHYQVFARIEPSVGYVGWDSMGVYDDPGIGKRELMTLNKQALANAHLISAAPDCYEQLKEADAVICDLCKCLNPQHVNCTSCEERKIRLKAIAKAEGK
jgi:hypothetical protein